MKKHQIHTFFFAAIAMSFAQVCAENVQLESDLVLFNTRCSQCHEVNKIMNEEILLPKDVSEIINRMSEKPGSRIQAQEKRRLYQIVLYKAYNHHRDILKNQLDELPPEEKNKEIEALKDALQPYK